MATEAHLRAKKLFSDIWPISFLSRYLPLRINFSERKARIDAPGAVHHIIVRGIERRKIFLDDFDRDNFLRRLDNVLSENATPCFALALIRNHAYLLLRTGTTAIATVMRSNTNFANKMLR